MHIVIQNYDIEVYAEVDHDHVLAGISVYQVSHFACSDHYRDLSLSDVFVVLLY